LGKERALLVGMQVQPGLCLKIVRELFQRKNKKQKSEKYKSSAQPYKKKLSKDVRWPGAGRL